MIESNLNFEFLGEAIKFDETKFYEKFKSYLTNGNGVDFLSMNSSKFIMLEVKNCTGYEKDNLWRTKTDFINEQGEESFDIEVAKKVAGTIACLVGAGLEHPLGDADDLKPYFQELTSSKYENNKKGLEVVFVLEGDFSVRSRDKKMIMGRIKSKIAEKLKWLNCSVRVVDSETYTGNNYSIEKVNA